MDLVSLEFNVGFKKFHKMGGGGGENMIRNHPLHSSLY